MLLIVKHSGEHVGVLPEFASFEESLGILKGCPSGKSFAAVPLLQS